MEYERKVAEKRSMPGVIQRSREKIFKFDHVFVEKSTPQIFRETVLPQIEHTMAGFNTCIFAYGATGSGKTFTMFGGSNKDPGMIECSIVVRIYIICRKFSTGSRQMQNMSTIL